MSWSKNDLDPAGDFYLFDGIEEVSYYRFLPATDAYDDAFTVDTLCREVGETNVMLSSGETTAIDLVFHIPRSAFDDQNFLPRRFDKIVREENRGGDGDEIDVTYIVQQVRWSTLGTRYRLECTRQIT